MTEQSGIDEAVEIAAKAMAKRATDARNELRMVRNGLDTTSWPPVDPLIFEGDARAALEAVGYERKVRALEGYERGERVGRAKFSITRDARQETVRDWCEAAFGVGQASSLEQRGLRLVEEAIEAAQACKCDPAQLHALIDYVYAREATFREPVE